MIEVTDEMIYAFAGEPEITATDAHAIRVGLAAVLALVERDRAAALARIEVSIDMHDSGAGRFIARIVEDCRCGKWGITATLANWSNLASITESARLHLNAGCTP